MMTKVRFIARSAGPGGVIRPGDVVDVPEREAELLVNGRYAEYVGTVHVETYYADDAVIAEQVTVDAEPPDGKPPGRKTGGSGRK